MNSLPLFFQNLPIANSNSSPLLTSCFKVLNDLRVSKTPADPTPFLLALKNVISKAKGAPFNIHNQHDAPEILTYILNELSLHTLFVSNLFETSIRIVTMCDLCNQENIREESVSIIHLQTLDSIQNSIDNFFSEEHLVAEDAPYCNYCAGHYSATQQKQIFRCGTYLIFQLIRFTIIGNVVSNNRSYIRVHPGSPNIKVKVDDEVSFNKHLSLRAIINHIGGISNGHNTSVTLDSASGSWIHCNDRAILPASEELLNGEFPYLLFYEIN